LFEVRITNIGILLVSLLINNQKPRGRVSEVMRRQKLGFGKKGRQNCTGKEFEG
jgi:hypothetical protein